MAEEDEAPAAAGGAAGGSVLKKYGPLAAIVLLAQVVLAWVVIQVTIKDDVSSDGDTGEALLSESADIMGEGEEEVSKDLPYFFPSEVLSSITFNPAGTNAERFAVIGIELGLSGVDAEGQPLKPEMIGADGGSQEKITQNITLIQAKILRLLRSKTIDELDSEMIGEVAKELRDVLNTDVFDKIPWDEEGKMKIKVQEVEFSKIIVQ